MARRRLGHWPGVGSRLLLFLLVSGVCGVLVAVAALPVTAALGLATRTGAESFEALPADLETPPLPQRSRILDSRGRTIAQFYHENRISLPLSRVSPAVRDAIVAIEDARFYAHGGVDLRGTMRAFVSNQTGESVQGGSTLTQQYVKLVQLDAALDRGDEQAAEAVTTRSGAAGYARKLRELRYAIALEDRLTKDEILERYLNIAYFGSGAYGIEAAARHYFGKTAKDLTIDQSALLAGIVQSPGRYDPTQNPEAATARRNLVLQRMADLGYLTSRQHRAARRAPLGVRETPVPNGCSSAAAAFFCDYVVQLLQEDPAFGKTREERLRLLLRGGLTIRTTLDAETQTAAQEAVDSHIPRKDPSGIGTAIAVIKPGDGAVVAMAQNRTWGTQTNQRGVTAINYSVDRKYGGSTYGFQAGSTFKPFTVAAAIKQGIPMSLRIPSPEKKVFDGFRNCETGARFAPREFENSTRSGTFDMRDGLAYSVNTWALGLQERTGLCAPVDVAESLGVHQADNERRLSRVPTFTLGVDGVTPLTMAEAYGTFAARGKHCSAYAITEVRDRTGKVIPRTKTRCRQALEPAVADAVNYLLQGVVDFGTGQAMNLGRPTAGKTGTTNSNYDVWFVGFTPNLAAAVWVGDPGRVQGGQIVRRPMRNIRIGGETVSAAAGSTVAGPIWKQAMRAAVADLPARGFVSPNPKVVRGAAVEVPDVIGLSRSRALAKLEAVGLEGRISVRRISSSLARGSVADTSPGPGESSYSGSEVVVYLSSGERPRDNPRTRDGSRDEPRATATSRPKATAEPRPKATAKPRPKATATAHGGRGGDRGSGPGDRGGSGGDRGGDGGGRDAPGRTTTPSPRAR